MQAVLAWLDEAAAAAREARKGLVVLMQANPFVTVPRDGFARAEEEPRSASRREAPARSS